MKEEVLEYDEKEDNFGVLQINKKQFVLTTNKKKILFDLDK